MKKFKAQFNTIREVEILRETDKQVVFLTELSSGKQREDRQSKISDWTGYFDSWDEAHEWLLAPAQRKLAYAQKNYDEIAALKK